MVRILTGALMCVFITLATATKDWTCQANRNYLGDCLGGNNCPATGLTLPQCQDLCFSTSGCGAIVHNGYNNGSCYVKGEKGGVTVDDEVHGTTSCAPSQGESGPGVGSWEVAPPADYGLSQNAISAVDDRMASRYRNRVCHLVVKEGKIVYENYRQGWTESSIRNGASSTKTACAALYGIATEQGWASPNDRVRDRNSGTRDCNRNATFGNVLTMTGESNNIDNPTFNYDASGRACLDTIADFIGENNPEGLTQEAWKDKYWTEALGIEHSTWGEGDGTIRCGSSIQYSCRDLARSAQLFLNNGMWGGEQVMSEQHGFDSRIRTVGSFDYGYTMWLQSNDSVDPTVSEIAGAGGQCAFISPKNNAIVVSMGNDGDMCLDLWRESRDSLVSSA